MANLVFHSRRMGDQNMHKKYLHCTYGFQIEPLSRGGVVLFWNFIFF